MHTRTMHIHAQYSYAQPHAYYHLHVNIRTLRSDGQHRPTKVNAYKEMKFVQCKLEPQKEVNDFMEKEIDVMDADDNGDEHEEASAIFGSYKGDGVQSEKSRKGKGSPASNVIKKRINCNSMEWKKCL